MIADQERLFADLPDDVKRTLAQGITRLAGAAASRITARGGVCSWSP
jgi:hypothetical protein